MHKSKEISKTDEKYWSAIWEQETVPDAINPSDRSLDNTIHLRVHEFISMQFEEMNISNMKLLEVGCARSRYLPYFARQFGFIVSGLDYSDIGCQKSRAILRNEGVEGQIYHADMYNPPNHLKGNFDVVFSSGLVEHFENTKRAIAACASFLKPGGIMITFIPNLSGMLGPLQKFLDREVYDIHVVLNKKQLLKSHELKGIEVIECRYFMFMNNNVLTTHKIKNPFWNRLFRRILSISTKPFWMIEKIIGVRFPGNGLTSPYIACVVKKDDI